MYLITQYKEYIHSNNHDVACSYSIVLYGYRQVLCIEQHMHTLLCPGPVPATVADFWKMIWDQRISIVVMLTRTMEGTKVCVHIYP